MKFSNKTLTVFSLLLERGYWQKAVDVMFKHGFTSHDIFDACRDINWYPSKEFGEYVREHK